jgi:polyhydroxyalkanoate synthesis regulator phasin
MDMTTKTKIVAGAVGALLLAVAVGAAGAVAASRALGDDRSQAIIDDAADQLGVESDELANALKQALKNRVDEAVEDGRLTEEQGEELKERIDSGETPLIFPGFGPRGDLEHHGHFGGLDAAATYLGLTEEELHERLRDGDALAEVARAEGKSVDGLVDAMVADARERVDEAVEDGRLTGARANELEQELEERITDLVNGEFPDARPFGRRGFDHRPGFGFDFGPQHDFRGPRA